MKMKLITSVFTILSFMSLNAAQADTGPCNAGDIFVESSHECIYCPNTLIWTGGATGGLSCPGDNPCKDGTDPNRSKTGWCDYCSAGYVYKKDAKACKPELSKK